MCRSPLQWWIDRTWKSSLASRLAEGRLALSRFRGSARPPRIAVVKQDINEDLYCCPPGAGPKEIVESTLLRSGPVCLFSEWNADFFIVSTVADPECSIWQERATHLHWDTLEFFSSYRDLIPGRDFGQKRFAVDAEKLDWNRYEFVISVDVSIPERVTRKFPNTIWCYYVREIKSPAYLAALERPHPGQDLLLNHRFRMRPPRQAAHVVEFPYHLQRPGCFHRLLNARLPDDGDRKGVFVDHHSMLALSQEFRQRLRKFGPVSSTVANDGSNVPTSVRLARRTMEPDIRERLLTARYFLITPGVRKVFGTAVVEAIAAGCLAIGSPRNVGCGELFTEKTAANTPDEALVKLRQFEEDPELFASELEYQRSLIEYLCYVRPMSDLLGRCRVPRSQSATHDLRNASQL